MKYADARSLIKSGDLLAWSHRGWGSWYDLQIQAVRIFTRSEYCHVGVAWVIGGRVFVLEAVKPLVRIFPLSKLLPFYWLPLDAPWCVDAEELALSHIGEPYSTLQAINGFLQNLTPGEDSQWQCAEYVATVLRTNGVDLGDTITPSALVLAAQNRGAVMRLLAA